MTNLIPKIPAHDFHIIHSQNETLDRLKSGEISDLRIDVKWPADAILSFALREGFLQQGLNSFPDPRKTWSVPIEAILTSQILRSLNDEHSFLLAPYMLNSADLITQLGYNIKTLEDGFNDQNIHPRQAPFHGETLKHILLKTKAESIIDWFNQKWQPIWKAQAPGRTHQYILDGMKIHIPEHLKKKFQDCGVVRDDEGNLAFGYKAVFLYEIIDRKGVIVAMKIAPIQVHDIVLGRELVKDFDFEKESLLIMDRGFIDGAWITELKSQRQIDVCIPLRRNMDVTQAAIAQADHRKGWESHPTRDGQQIYEIARPDLYWKECEYLQSGVLVRWQQKNGEQSEVLFVTTKYGVKGAQLLEIYDQRAEIEEAHRQVKTFQGIEKLLSKKYVNVVFRIVIAVIGYNIFNLFLNSESCKDFAEYSLKTLRQRKPPEKNPKLIVYTEKTFAVISMFEFMPIILGLKKSVQEKLSDLFVSLGQAQNSS